jgi:hypothetical protein
MRGDLRWQNFFAGETADQISPGRQSQDGKDARLDMPPTPLARADEVIE